MQRAPINSLDRVKSAGEVVDEEGEWGMIANSFVLLFSRSIDVGEKLGVDGSMLSHIAFQPLFFSDLRVLYLRDRRFSVKYPSSDVVTCPTESN